MIPHPKNKAPVASGASQSTQPRNNTAKRTPVAATGQVPARSAGGADALLSRLDGVKQFAHGRWRARCPAHDGKNRDVLSIAETNDGTVLVKCFHGCTVADVVAAVGLTLHDLFPHVEWQATGIHHARPARRPRVDWPALIAATERDLILVKIVLAAIGRGESLDADDVTACQTAATRVYTLIQEARHG